MTKIHHKYGLNLVFQHFSAAEGRGVRFQLKLLGCLLFWVSKRFMGDRRAIEFTGQLGWGLLI